MADGRPTPSARSLWRRVVHAYEAVQVELRGSYSVERLLDLRDYAASCSAVWCGVVLLATPFPCVAVAILVDAVPLHPSSYGLAHSHFFWWRVALVSACVTYTILEQLRVFVPRLSPTTAPVLLAMSTVVGVGCSAYGILMASLVGFPLPFTLFFGSPSWQLLFWLGVLVKWGRELRHDRGLRAEVVSFYKVVIVQLSLTVVYPAYNHFFTRLHGVAQTAFALGLPVLKILAKNAFHRVFCHSEDFLPEVVIFNVEIFHALFVSTCMQSSTSLATTGVIMVADVVQAWAHMLDVDAILSKLNRLDSKRHASLSSSCVGMPAVLSTQSVSPVTTALVFVGIGRALHADPTIRLVAVHPPPSPPKPSLHPRMSAIHPIPPIAEHLDAPVVANLNRLTRVFSDEQLAQLEAALSRDERRKYVRMVLRVLHFTEFLVLIEFVEVVVPLVYCSYLVAIAHMPNRVFYPQLAHMNAQSLWSTIGSICAYTLLEFASFIGLCIVLQRKLRISPIRQLAFVLHKQWNLVQSKMVLWVVVIVGTSLEQFGYDYTFKFAWLKGQHQT